jgi:hypothetical protein
MMVSPNEGGAPDLLERLAARGDVAVQILRVDVRLGRGCRARLCRVR